MLTSLLQKKYSQYLEAAGIKINGANPQDIQVLNDKLYQRVLLHGSLGFGEAYMDNWWSCEKLDVFFEHLFRLWMQTNKQIRSPREALNQIISRFANLQKISRAFEIGKRHYDLSNTLFEKMLDSNMNYSCGYWKDADNLEDAQQAKMRLIAEKLKLEKGMTVLDVGCGWGGMAKFAAENYEVSVVGVTVSEMQAKYAQDFCKGLPVEIRLQDYRSVTDKFDRAYSIGMFEHVGVKNYQIYMKKVRDLLDDDGLFVLHTIGSLSTHPGCDPWIAKYIFPNSSLPSATHISEAIEDIFVMEDWQNFGADYDKTLLAWNDNIARSWDSLKSDYDEKFFRMWTYYLLMCAGGFRSRLNQLWQVVLSPFGVAGSYRSPR